MPWFKYQKLGKSYWGIMSRSLAHSVAFLQKVLATSVLGDAVTGVALLIGKAPLDESRLTRLCSRGQERTQSRSHDSAPL